MSDEDLSGEAGESRKPEKQPVKPADLRAVPAKKASRPGFFTIYKKGQGYWTRMGTAIGAAFLCVMLTYELYVQIPPFLHGDPSVDKRIAGIVAGVFLLAFAGWAWWYTNKPGTVDFLVATDSEMKKVNWTTRAELIGSTKIVIVFMFLIAAYLFGCDLIFGELFKLMGVLKQVF